MSAMNAYWWAVMSACVWGGVPLIEKAGLARTAPITGVFYRSLGVLLGFLILSIAWVKPGEVRSVDMKSAILLMTGGLLASIVGQIFFYNALKLGEISKMVLVGGSYPVITFLLGILVFGESVNLYKILGAALVMAGLVLLKRS